MHFILLLSFKFHIRKQQLRVSHLTHIFAEADVTLPTHLLNLVILFVPTLSITISPTYAPTQFGDIIRTYFVYNY